jgi:hypothetical protein
MVSEFRTGAVQAIFRQFFDNYSIVTEGVVIESSVKKVSGRLTGGYHYYYNVKYSYEVHGVTYISKYVRNGSFGSYAFETVNNYPVGKSVKVFVDSTNPTHSVLEVNNGELSVYSTDALLLGVLAISLILAVVI